MKVAEGYCPLPNARLSHLRKPRPTNVHGKSLYLCQYTGELSPKAYGVTIYGVRQGSFKDMSCLLSFLASVINGEKAEEKEKKDALSLYNDIVTKFSMETKPVLAPNPMDLFRFGGTLRSLDDRYVYSWPDMSQETEKNYLFDPDIHDEGAEEKPASQPKFELQIPLDFKGNSFVIDYKEANLRTFRTQLSEFLSNHVADIDASCVSFKHMDDKEQEEIALNFTSLQGKKADFIIRPYKVGSKKANQIRKARVVKPKTNYKQDAKERKKAMKKYDKEIGKTIVRDILADRQALEEGEVVEK